ncbi:nucleotidyltransferase [Ferroplasma acidiphilum]|uniref:Nucleotidyltransferase n=1 Tax=Ferroplasma acidiphilum TaxID=74969 RepID=A0A1V0N4G7_9ARCH|nr:nucleotidyltransferase [Ferroplasma acidiphilum]
MLTILIGSLARGDCTPFSDADVIIITDSTRSEIEFMDPHMPIDIEPRVFTIN